MFRYTDVSVKEWYKLFGPFVLIFLLGLVIRVFYPFECPVSDAVHALADAFMVAGIVGSLIEMFSSKFLMERVADELSEKLVGRGLPSELQAHILEITRTDFVRTNYAKDYSLSEPDENGLIRVSIKTTFKVVNYSDSTKDYVPKLEEETFYNPTFSYLEYGLVGEELHVCDASKLIGMVKTGTDTNVKSVTGEEKIALESIKRNDKAECHVRWDYEVMMPQQYTDVTNFAAATIGATLSVGKVPNGFEFLSSGDPNHVRNSKSWYFKGPFIKGQHIRAWWFKK